MLNLELLFPSFLLFVWEEASFLVDLALQGEEYLLSRHDFSMHVHSGYYLQIFKEDIFI